MFIVHDLCNSLLKNKSKFSRDVYTCEETIIEISIERNHQHSLMKQYKKLDINWQLIDDHLEDFNDLFNKRRKITLNMEFVYKKITRDSITAKNKKKKKKTTTTKTQKLQRTTKVSL
ncbi:hypothetical protein F5884DRAFT_540987 [Xylogone sp. PMI_703]|nr:hypothetical protein F5884DRAFT_540987 [Xylogone sp. PMI_703]